MEKEEIKIKEYGIDKDQCKTMIHGVCAGCGGELEPIETVDNSNNPTYWAGCLKCNSFDWGVDPHVFEIAKELVINHNHVEYRHMERPDGKGEEYKKYWLSSQIRGTTSIVLKILILHKKWTNT